MIVMGSIEFTPKEKQQLRANYRVLRKLTSHIIPESEVRHLRERVLEGARNDMFGRTRFGHHPVLHSLNVAIELCGSMGADRNMVLAVLLYNLGVDMDEDNQDVQGLIRGLQKVSSLYSTQATVKSDNFRKLLLTFAEDIRVIIIMIVDRLVLMRAINHHPAEELVREVAFEASYLYAPLAHRLGLYKIKSDLEDMSLKYTDRDMYSRIARKLNETKKSRDAYIEAFIAPVKEALQKQGLNFDIKGRTKSIFSIWNKMKKQNTDLDHIYDLFAIRVILDVPPERERPECWLAYSVVTDMYTPNPARLKDWLSIPKSNGYESLHITVKGPQNKWVEVQIRSRRMDEIAEKGIAAHWKYKGIKSESDLDTWMNHVRDILETADSGPMELMKNMKMDMYNKEVFVFTPKGDLYKLPLGATVLDFAFNIHSGLGCKCIGGKVNGKSRKINHKLASGDTVEVLTAVNQTPKMDWLQFLVTSKARTKVRQAVNEMANRSAELAKELLQRRFKNRKIEIEEAALMRVIKKLGFKTVTEFYNAISSEQLDVNDVINQYEMMDRKVEDDKEKRSAEEFQLQTPDDENSSGSDSDVLVIGDNVKGMNYRLAKCCNPIYGDEVFGFVSAEGIIKIHRKNCPNAANIYARYPYRIISTRWSGRLGQQFGTTLRVVGNDDIGIVTNITSIINKEKDATLRSISIESHDGLFNGFLVVGVTNKESLNQIIKKIKTVKGVKDVQRSN